MESLYLTGVGANDTIVPPPRMGVCVKDVQIILPHRDTTADPYINISGASGTTNYMFRDNATLDLRFRTDEIVTVSGTSFSGDYSAVVNYVTFGDSGAYLVKRNRERLPLPSRLTRSTRDGA